MRLALVRFEPSGINGEHSVDVPAGSTVLVARMEARRGEGELILSVPDDSKGTEPCAMLFLFEDPPTEAGGDPSLWRHVGSWNYRSGAWQHCFARVAAAAKKRSPDGLTVRAKNAGSADVSPDPSRSEAS